MKNIIILGSLLFISVNNYGQTKPAAPAPAATSTTSFAKSVGLYVFPAKNQTAEVQSKDDADCYKWAVQESKYDPLNPTKAVAAKADTDPSGEAVVGAAKGAAAGVAIGAIAGDAGKGAAIGAVAGGLAGRRAKKTGDAKEQQANNQAADKANADMVNSFKKAFTVCLEAKGYTVK